jgi:hypothetical protein
MGTIVASSPGDIVIEFNIASGSSVKSFTIPLKSISASKSMEESKEYGIGSHQAYADVVGKIGYEGDFTIGSWWVSDEANPSTWNHLVREYLTYQDDEGLPREFTINIHARGGSSMVRKGTGMYGVADRTSLSDEEFTLGSGSGSAVPDSMIIESYQRCILKGDSIDIPEVGGTVSKKYPFSCLKRDPK